MLILNIPGSTRLMFVTLRPKRFLIAFSAITLLNVSMLGCAQVDHAQKTTALNFDCRSCHAPNGAAGAKDFSSIYSSPASHHPVGVRYPLGSSAFPNFNVPNVQGTDIAFFDRNGNGKPDDNEIQLFGTSVTVSVECASCHKAHGGSPAPVNSKANAYLRIDNIASALCMTCHRQ